MPSIFLAICILCFNSITFSQEISFREKIRAKIKERLIQREQEKPAPKVDIDNNAKITKPGTYNQSLRHQEIVRMYRLHVPSTYRPEIASPLIVSLHGGGGSMDYQSNDEYYKQISKSEKEGFIIVFPNGFSQFKSGKFATWNAGKCCGDARDKNIDDVGFIKKMITTVSQQLNIDEEKIYATGMSNGGMLTYQLACELADVFKAIAPVAGTDNTIECNPQKPISVFHIHAKNDDHVLFGGGSGKSLTNNKAKVTEFSSVDFTISKWVKKNGCNEVSKQVLKNDDVYCNLYSGCLKNVKVQVCVTRTGGHSWPGGKKVRSGEAPSEAISANDMMWDFFKTL